MRHKYATTAIVLARTPLSEGSMLVTLLTAEVGLIRARAQGLRKPGAKMASALQTFRECEVMLLRGKEGWRMAGAIPLNDWFSKLTPDARVRAGRVATLLLRLVSGETADADTYDIFQKLLAALAKKADETETTEDAIECLAALRMLHALGVDAGDIPGGMLGSYAPELLEEVTDTRAELILRINRGIAASGL
jgi:DNA repair protein RecO